VILISANTGYYEMKTYMFVPNRNRKYFYKYYLFK
jgi:hypothetical protein